MAKDITIRVTGQNADGSLNVQQLDGANPFMSQPSTAMVPYNSSAAMQPVAPSSYRAKFLNIDVNFASEADYLRADRALREMLESQNAMGLGNLTITRGTGTASSWLRTGASAAEAVAGFLSGRNIRRKMDDLDEALAEARAARQELESFANDPVLGKMVPALRRISMAERDVNEIGLSVLEDQLTAVDIQTGSGVAKVAADLLKDGPSLGESSGLGTAVAVGGAGLGLGLLLSSNRDGERSRRRR
jgi:hypothetical protein